MDSQGDQVFNCTTCGKVIKWTPAIAGKTGRCKCGATIRVPESIDQPDGDDFLYAVEEPAVPAAAQARIVPAPPPLAAKTAPAIPKKKKQIDEGEIDVVRDLWIPVGVLVLGNVGIVAWLGFHGWLNAGAVTFALFLATSTMIVKTGVLSLLAWIMARASGGSFGNVPTTILKIAALVVVLDAATLWMWAAMVQMGAITPSGRFYIVKTILAMFLATLVVAALIVQFLYGLQGDEANVFSRFVAGGNLAANIIMLIAVTIVVHMLANAAKRVMAAAPVPVPTLRVDETGSPSPPPPADSAVGGADRQIARRIGMGTPFVFEARYWARNLLDHPEGKPITALIDNLYAAGAGGVYVQQNGGFPIVYVELPASADQRAACFDLASRFKPLSGHATVSPAPPGTARYLEIDLVR